MPKTKALLSVTCLLSLFQVSLAATVSGPWFVTETWDASACGGEMRTDSFQGYFRQSGNTVEFLKEREPGYLRGVLRSDTLHSVETLVDGERTEILEVELTIRGDRFEGAASREISRAGVFECAESGSYEGWRVAVNMPGTVSSIILPSGAESSTVSAATLLATPVITTSVSGNVAKASWGAISGATGYKLHYAPYPALTPKQAMDVQNVLSISRALPIGTYAVAVQAYNGETTSEVSRWTTINITAGPPPTPTLSLSVLGTAATASWNAVTGATGYVLHYAPYPAGTPQMSVDLKNTTSMTKVLPAGARFYVSVQAYNSLGSSAMSSNQVLSIDANPIGSGPAQRLAVSSTHACGLTNDNEAYCWGENRYTGTGLTDAKKTFLPMKVAGGLKFASLASTDGHATFGLTADGDLYAWGSNLYGQLGDGSGYNGSGAGSSATLYVPTKIAMPAKLKEIRAGGPATACGLDFAGNVYCWGSWPTAGGNRMVTTPTLVPSPIKFASLRVGDDAFVALANDGSAYAWGNNSHCRLGNGSSLCSNVLDAPVKIGGDLKFKDVSIGSSNACGLSQAGDLYCWGDNQKGQFKDYPNLQQDFTLTTLRTPTKMETSLRFKSITVGGRGLVALASDGLAYIQGWEWKYCGTTNPSCYAAVKALTLVSSSVKFDSIVAGSSIVLGVESGTGSVRGWGPPGGYLNTGTEAGSDLAPLEAAKPGFKLTVNPATASVSAGNSIAIGVTMTPEQGGFNVNGLETFSGSVNVVLEGVEGTSILGVMTPATLTPASNTGTMLLMVPSSETAGTKVPRVMGVADGLPKTCASSGGGFTSCTVRLSVTAAVAAGGSYAYPPRPNILDGHPACTGYTVLNYQQYFAQHSSGPDVQLHTLCAASYSYYAMYLNAIRLGYPPSQSDITYEAFSGTARQTINFYESTRGGTGF